MGILLAIKPEFLATLQAAYNFATLTNLLRQFFIKSWIIYSHPDTERGRTNMRPPAPTLSSKNRYPSTIIVIGLFSGILITALIWLKLPNQLITSLSLFSLSLIGLGGFLYFRKPISSRPRWIIILAAVAAVSLVYLFPELFGPTCGGMPRAFASPSARCGRCVDFFFEWNDKKHQQ